MPVQNHQHDVKVVARVLIWCFESLLVSIIFMSSDLSGSLKIMYAIFPSTRPKPNALAHLNKPHNLRFHLYNTNNV